MSMSSSTDADDDRNFSFKQLVPVVLVAGVLLRTLEFARGRSLWLDEAFLSLNILELPLSDLMRTLHYDQVAPLLFLSAQKGAVTLFGSSEYALRLVPFSASIAALFVFRSVSREVFAASTASALLALTLFAVCDPLIYFAAEAKQYGVDILVALGVSLLAIRAERGALRDGLLFCLAGVCGPWLSFPSVFIVPGACVYLIASSLRARDFNRLGGEFLTGLAAAGSLTLCYFLHLRSASNSFLEAFWAWAFWPGVGNWSWLGHQLDEFLVRFSQLSAFSLPLSVLLIIGLVSLIRRGEMTATIGASAFILSLIASLFHKYPLYERFLVFLVPFCILCLTEAVRLVGVLFGKKQREWAIIPYALVLAFPLNQALLLVDQPRNVQELRPVLNFLKSRAHGGDNVYLFHLASYPFKYYGPLLGIAADPPALERYANKNLMFELGACPSFIGGGSPSLTFHRGTVSYFTSEEYADVIADLACLVGQERAWILLSHSTGGKNVREAILRFLQTVGEMKVSYRQPGYFGGSELFLFDLSKTKPLGEPERRALETASEVQLRAGYPGRAERYRKALSQLTDQPAASGIENASSSSAPDTR